MTAIDQWSEETKYIASRIWDYVPDEPDTTDYGTCDFCGAEYIDVHPVDDADALQAEEWQKWICHECEQRIFNYEGTELF